jgi:hypothetical protein
VNIISKIFNSPLFFVLLVLFGMEFGSRLLFTDFSKAPIFSHVGYTSDEMDTNSPLFLKENGQECIHISNKFNWNQWWGFSSKELDIKCAKNLFAGKDLTIAFMGGSVAAGAGAINYRTSIDFYTTKDLKNFASINLAETGARHKNMSIRFQREVIPLNPKIVFFIDGFNEFNSVRYGGSPSNDFYWTAGVRNRVHHPFSFYIDKLIEVSKFAEALLVRTGLYSSARIASNKTSIGDIHESANTYLKDVEVTKALCDSYKIKCFFIIQPQIFYSDINEHNVIVKNSSKFFINFKNENIYGFENIIKNCEFCIDYSELLMNQSNTFYDPVHFGKHGNYILGKKLENLIKTVN